MSLAFVFPGQGSQYLGMGRELVQWSPEARSVFEEADDALGFALSRICFEGPEEDLKLTEITQPAILTASIAALRAMVSRLQVVPEYVAGHSLGEYSALVAAECISFADAVRVVRERGRAMQKAVPAGQGSMAALLGVDRETVASICEEASSPDVPVSPANFNAPGQIVIAGVREGILKAIDIFRRRGGRKAVELPVSAPFHCSLMKPAASRMEEVLKDIRIDRPKTVLINNAGAVFLSEASQIVPSLVEQVTSPVLWEDSVRAMMSKGVRTFIEIGPGRVLTGLIKRIDGKVHAHSFGLPEEFDAIAALMEEEDV